MTWNARRKGWMGPPLRGDGTIPGSSALPPAPTPPIEVNAVLVVPPFPSFSPASIAQLLKVNRCTVHWWLENGKLLAFRDNIGERYVLRDELIKFVREYLRRNIDE